MADRYWVGGAGAWAGTAHWAATSGGAAGETEPTIEDDVYFDANSGLISGSEVNANDGGTQRCKSFTATTGVAWKIAATNAANRGELRVEENFTGEALFTIKNGTNPGAEGVLLIEKETDTNSVIRTNGCIVPKIQVYGADAPNGVLSFIGDVEASLSIDFSAMNVSSGSSNLKAPYFNLYAAPGDGGARTINMGSGIWDATGADADGLFPFTIYEESTGGLTIVKGTSTVQFSDATPNKKTFSYTDGDGVVRGKAWGKLKIKNGNGTTSYEIVGEHSWDDIISEDQVDNYAIKFEALTTQTFGAFHLSGVPNKLIEIRSTTPGDAVTFSVASGTVSIDYVDIKDVAATGGATWVVGANSNDGGGNTGFTFTPDVAAVLTVTPIGELKSNPITIRVQHNGDAYDTTGGLGLADGSIPVASWAIVLQDLYGGLYFGPSHAFTDLDVTDSFTLPYGEYQDIYVVGQYGNGEYSQTSNEYLIYSVVSPSAVPFSVVINPGVKPKTKRDNTKTHIINSNLSGKKFPGPKGTTPLVVDCQLMQSELGDALASFTPDWETVGTTIENDTSTLNGGVIVARGYNYDKLMKFHAHKKQQFKSDGVLDPTRTAYFIAFYQTVDPETGVPSYGRRELAAFRPVMDKEKIRVPSNNPSDIEDDDDDGDYEEEKYGRDFYSAGILPQYTREWFIVLCFGELPAAGPFTDGDYPYSNDSSRYATLTNGWWEVKTGVRRVV